MQSFKDYQNLNKAIVELLAKEELFIIDIIPHREKYITGLQKVLNSIMDFQFDADKYSSFYSDIKSEKDPDKFIDLVNRYIGESMENDNTYVIINHYSMESLLLYISLVKDEALITMEELLNSNNIDASLLERVEQSWDEFKVDNPV